MKIKVAIAEDNDMLATSIREKLDHFKNDIQVVFRAENGKDLIEKLKDKKDIQIILMDIEMPEMDGISATKKIKNLFPDIKSIILTVFDDDDKIFSAIQAGAMGYLLKDEPASKIADSIKMAMHNGAPMSPSIAMKSLELLRNASLQTNNNASMDYELTKRETEILELLSTGLDYNHIAEKLFISPATVRKHIENIYHKLQVHNKMEAVRKAMKHRII